MPLLAALLVLAAGLHQCVGKEKDAAAFAALSADLLKTQKEIVDKHNNLRKQVEPKASNMLKMEWNGTTADHAKHWAEECTETHSPHSERDMQNHIQCSESLYMSVNPIPWNDVIQAWFNERENFTYAKGPKQENAVVGHYIQLVWHRSFMIGCAVSHCQHAVYKYFYVCQYCPANSANFYTPYKEGKQCGDCPNNCDDGLCTNPCKYEDALDNCADLKKAPTCSHPNVKNRCPASCECTTEIQ